MAIKNLMADFSFLNVWSAFDSCIERVSARVLCVCILVYWIKEDFTVKNLTFFMACKVQKVSFD